MQGFHDLASAGHGWYACGEFLPHQAGQPGREHRTGARKTLGGIQTDLDSRALGSDGQPVPGLYAAGEAAGFGGGGVHGYNSLEGTFLGGCLFSGRQAGRATAAALASSGAGR